MRSLTKILPALVCAVAVVAFEPSEAQARRWEVRQEVREGAREVGREKREAMRELRRCNTRECARREIREGQREVSRERREARREIRGEVRENNYDNYYRGNNRWYRDGRNWDRGDYERRYYYRRDNDGGDVLKGALIGAAVVGVVAAIADSKDIDD